MGIAKWCRTVAVFLASVGSTNQVSDFTCLTMAGDTRPPDKPNGTQVASISMTSAWAVDGASGKEVKMRSYAEIIAEEREQRNILEIKLTRLDEADGSETKAKALTFDDIGELIFDVLHVDQSD